MEKKVNFKIFEKNIYVSVGKEFISLNLLPFIKIDYFKDWGELFIKIGFIKYYFRIEFSNITFE